MVEFSQHKLDRELSFAWFLFDYQQTFPLLQPWQSRQKAQFVLLSWQPFVTQNLTK